MRSRFHGPSRGVILVAALALLLGLPLTACGGGGGGSSGADGSSTGTVEGLVTNAMSGAPIPGATIVTDPVVPGVVIVTDGSGQYSAVLPIGTYTLTCSVPNCNSEEAGVSVIADGIHTVDLALDPVAPVIVEISAPPSGPAPGASFPLVATVTVMDGSTGMAYLWTQSHSAAAVIANETTDTATITLGDAAAYKTELFDHLNPPDRFMVQGVNPFSLELAGHVAFEVAVTTSSGTYTAEADVHSDLGAFAKVAASIHNVPLGVPVLLHGKDQATYDWAFVLDPAGGTTFDMPTGRNPSFTPAATGKYEIEVTDLGDPLATPTPIPPFTETLTIYVGTWTGIITGKDPGDGLPLMADCLTCHAPGGAFELEQFDEWRQSGHAHILTNNLDTSTHYGPNCFACHGVGFDTDVANGGMDDAGDYGAFLGGGLLNNPGDNWTTMLGAYPATAKLSNIQCENCHGPQNTLAHGFTGDFSKRVSLSSDVCATCHGEPKRHARFQQWELSAHSNYELAESRGGSNSCGRCHSAQGFQAWLPQLEAGNPGNITDVDFLDWGSAGAAREAHPQTCTVCHPPHNPGAVSGENNDVILRVHENTSLLPNGFVAWGVGNGAMCITCHNQRNGQHDDMNFAGTLDDRAPHGSSQGDVLMAQNAYFVTTHSRSGHSLIENTCTNCHMIKTDPPDELSYNLGGTNHTFGADVSICAKCHGEFTAAGTQDAVEIGLGELESTIEDAIMAEIAQIVADGFTLTVEGTDDAEAPLIDVIGVGDVVNSVHLTESHGRMAMDISVNGVMVHHVRLAGDTTVNTTPTATNLLTYSAAGQLIARAGWNYFIVHNDGSLGVHNPGWVTDILTQTIIQFVP